MDIKKLTRMALLTTISLTLFVVEAQIPVLAPIPGMKIGLANIITVYSMFEIGSGGTLCILLVRILLGNLITGQLMSLAFSTCGGLFCYVSMLVLVRVLEKRQMWICSVISSVFHVIGQMVIALILVGTSSILLYLPMLIVSSIITGLFTGMCAQTVSERLHKR